MTFTLFKVLCRGVVNYRGIRNNVYFLRKQFLKTSSSGVTIAEVKNDLMKSMGIEPGYDPTPSSREYLLKYLPESQEELTPRNMQDSFSEAIVPLSTDIEMREKYITFIGHIRIGRLLEDMDMFAVWIASKHICYPNHQPPVPSPYVLVTVLVDRISFTNVIPKPNEDIRLSGHISWVGKTSLECVVWLEQAVENKWVKLTRAIFLMAARNSTNTASAFVNPLVATSEYEQKIVDGGEGRKNRRQELATTSLLKVIPDESEQYLLHNLFIETLNLSDPMFHSRVLPDTAVWMRNSILSNIVLSHPQDRNLHNKVFGGFLMRNALELSWTHAFLYSKTHPRIRYIADIAFLKPVEVGSLIRLHSQVVFTEGKCLLIHVSARILDPDGVLQTTNNFHFVYDCRKEVKKVYPRSYHECIMYLDGRRRFLYLMQDE